MVASTEATAAAATGVRMQPHQQKRVFDAFTVGSAKSVENFSIRRNVLAARVASAWSTSASPLGTSSFDSDTAIHATNSMGNQCNALESCASALIFALPNSVEDDSPFSDPTNFRAPIKVAGDVSLSGHQLVAFLTKATMRLPKVKCEGVQLRLVQLREWIDEGRISESCIKKLNFVVDAIDRESYDDAWLFFEQLQSQFAEMWLSRVVRSNLNRRHWDRRAWETGYRGPLLPQQKATGRPDLPVSANRVEIVRQRLHREMGVMQMLARPYVTQEAEQAYFASRGVEGLDGLRELAAKECDAKRMPGKPKRVEGSKDVVRRRGNIGNLLHEHATVENSLKALIERKRWD